MNKLIRNIAAATVISAAFASSAFAMSTTSQSAAAALSRSNAGFAGLYVSVNKQGVATLSGNTNDSQHRARAAQVVKNVDGVTEVINLVTGS